VWQTWAPIIVTTVLIPLMGWVVRGSVLDAIRDLKASNARLGVRLGKLEQFRAVVEDRLGPSRRMTKETENPNE